MLQLSRAHRLEITVESWDRYYHRSDHRSQITPELRNEYLPSGTNPYSHTHRHTHTRYANNHPFDSTVGSSFNDIIVCSGWDREMLWSTMKVAACLPSNSGHKSWNSLSWSTLTMPAFRMISFIIAIALCTSHSTAFKLLGMPRFLQKSSPPVASSVAGHEITPTSSPKKDLATIGIPQSRELLKISDKNFSANILESEGLSIVFFTRWVLRRAILRSQKWLLRWRWYDNFEVANFFSSLYNTLQHLVWALPKHAEEFGKLQRRLFGKL